MSGAIAYKQETARKHRETSHWEVSVSNLHIVVVVVVLISCCLLTMWRGHAVVSVLHVCGCVSLESTYHTEGERKKVSVITVDVT